MKAELSAKYQLDTDRLVRTCSIMELKANETQANLP
jgi:hypothetical protein